MQTWRRLFALGSEIGLWKREVPSNRNDLTGEVELKIAFVPKNQPLEALKK